MTKLQLCIRLAYSVRKTFDRKWHVSGLRGACAQASASLVKLSNAYGLRPTFVHGTFVIQGKYPLWWIRHHDHCWVQYQDHVIDITATQFDPHTNTSHKKVLVVPKKDPRYKVYRKGINALDDWDVDPKWIESVHRKVQIAQAKGIL
jgi:hypothetical protein